MHDSNFCAKAGLSRTAEAFEAEWYELMATGRLGGLATSMPDVYLRNGVRPGGLGFSSARQQDDLKRRQAARVVPV